MITERPVRTGYHEYVVGKHGSTYHPAPDRSEFDAHADNCKRCAWEREHPELSGYVGRVVTTGPYR